MRLLFKIMLLLWSFSSFAGFKNYCGKVESMITWVGGGETYGVWVQFENNPSNCSSGFYLSQLGNNRELVYSFIMASKMSNQPICIQTDPDLSKISQRCKINYVKG